MVCRTPLQVIKNQPAYYHQARVEVGILQLLNGRCDPGDCHHIVRLHDAFLHRRHLCLAFEQLGINLFELLKRNGFRGLSLGLLRLFLQQVILA
jgi:dual specificity protein kinase YAK1